MFFCREMYKVYQDFKAVQVPREVKSQWRRYS